MLAIRNIFEVICDFCEKSELISELRPGTIINAYQLDGYLPFIKNGWKQKENKTFCKFCYNKHLLDYFVDFQI